MCVYVCVKDMGVRVWEGEEEVPKDAMIAALRAERVDLVLVVFLCSNFGKIIRTKMGASGKA